MAEEYGESIDIGNIGDENRISEIVFSIINEVVEACYAKYLPKESPGDVTEELRNIVEPIIDEIIERVVPEEIVQKYKIDEEDQKLKEESGLWMRNLLLQILSEKAFDYKPVLTQEQAEARERFRLELLQWLSKATGDAIEAKLDADYLKRGGWRRLLSPADKPPCDYFSYIKPKEKVICFEVIFYVDDGSVIRKDYQPLHTILDIKFDFQHDFSVPYTYITISKDDEELHDDVRLLDLKEKKPTECLTLDVKYEQPGMITYITVTIASDYSEEEKTLRVEIHKLCIVKPYLGGYKNRITGVEYQHAFSQTAGKVVNHAFGETLQRCTQTYYWRDEEQNTKVDSATQMYRPDHYIEPTKDRILLVGEYEDYESYLKRMDFDGKAIIIQKWWRGYLARKKFAAMMEQKRRDIEWELDQIRAEKEAYANFLKSEIVKKTYPFTREDFEKLYALINNWYSIQSYKISTLKTEAPRKAELFFLLNKEMDGLRVLEKWKKEAKKEKMVKDRKRFLALCSSPIKLISKCGKEVEIETLEIQQAERLRDIFMLLDETNVSSGQYIRNVDKIKTELADYNKEATEELIQLLNKECILLSRGMKKEDLALLHERIERMFIELAKDPDFNPEAAKYVQAHALLKRKIDTKTCTSCRKILTNSVFSLTCKSKKFQICKYCSYNKRISTTKTGMGPYQHIRELLCIDEAKQRSRTYFAFTMQIKDYHLLIDVLWHNESIISKCRDLNQLRLCRWNKCEEWSPWNCILLTLDEMLVHLKLPDLTEMYDDELIARVSEKHLVAKCHFRHLVDLEKCAQALGPERMANKFGVQSKDIFIY